MENVCENCNYFTKTPHAQQECIEKLKVTVKHLRECIELGSSYLSVAQHEIESAIDAMENSTLD